MIRRGLAFLIDWFFIFLIGGGLILISPDFDPAYLLMPSMEMFSAFGTIFGILCFVFLPLFREVMFGGASLGKRIMGLRVVKKGTMEKPSAGALILKNLTFYFPTVEAILFFANKGFTIGNLISGTAVVRRNDIT